MPTARAQEAAPPATETAPAMEPAPSEPVHATFDTPSNGAPIEPNATATPTEASVAAPADPSVTATPSDPNASPPAGEVLGMELPAISAKTYDLKLVRPSQSKQMYLFDKDTGALPDLGRVFLLRQGPAPIMGFRVVKLYAEKHQLAAKRIKDYPDQTELMKDSSYRAYEKVGEITSVPANTPADITDLNELEAPAVSDAAVTGEGESAKGVAPNVNGGPDDSLAGDQGSGDEEDDPDRGGDTPDGFAPNFLGFDVGAYRAINLPTGPYSTGFGFTYAHLLSKNSHGGGIAAEFGFGYYKSGGDVDTDDVPPVKVSQSFTMLPVAARLRYQFSLDEGWGYYVYAGGMYNHVLSQFGATETQVALAKTAVLGIGAGVFIPTGPNWYVKLNLGSDFIGGGLLLRF